MTDLIWLQDRETVQQIVDDLLAPNRFPPPTFCGYRYHNNPNPTLEDDFGKGASPSVYLYWRCNDLIFIRILIWFSHIAVERGYYDFGNLNTDQENYYKFIAINSYLEWYLFLGNEFSQWFKDIDSKLRAI